MAMVRPVFKKGSRDRAAHYRSISLTCMRSMQNHGKYCAKCDV